MKPSIICQTKEFLFANACRDCSRCEHESTKLLAMWGKTPLCEIPDHIAHAVFTASEILGREKAILAIKGGFNVPSN